MSRERSFVSLEEKVLCRTHLYQLAKTVQIKVYLQTNDRTFHTRSLIFGSIATGSLNDSSCWKGRKLTSLGFLYLFRLEPFMVGGGEGEGEELLFGFSHCLEVKEKAR